MPDTAIAEAPAMATTGGNILQVRNLEMAYGDNKVLHGIDLAIEAGESTLLLGESGSGKTTLARSIAGLNPGYTGDVLLRGKELAHSSRDRTLEHRKDVQYIFQSPFSSLNPRRTIGESMSVPLVMAGELSRDEQRAIVEETLEAVQLDRSFYDRRPGDLATVYADPTRVEAELGWRATRSIEQMCADTWRWQSANPQGYPG